MNSDGWLPPKIKRQHRPMATPEVEITRPFVDPRDRLNAMHCYDSMLHYLRMKSDVSFALKYCDVTDGVIVWRFLIEDEFIYKRFNEVFGSDASATPADQKA